MGFDCLSEADLRITYYMETDHLSDSLVNNQILRAIELPMRDASFIRFGYSVARFYFLLM